MNKTVLIVDDNPDMQKYVGVNLRMRGFTVISSSDTVFALEILEKEPVDLMLMNYAVSGKETQNICRRIRKISNADILLMTNGTEGYMDTFSMDCISKPFGVEDVLYQIQKITDSRQEKSNEHTRTQEVSG